MTASEIEGLKILALVTPVLAIGMALLAVWLTGQLDRLENRRRAPRTMPGE